MAKWGRTGTGNRPSRHTVFSTKMRRPALIAFLLLAIAAPAALAEIVVFQDGHVVKAASYRVVEEELEIGLPGGGSYRVDLARVERIVDDEIVISDVTIQVADAGKPEAYYLSYREDRKPLFSTPYDTVIAAESKRYGVDASLVSAVIRAESNY